MEEKIDIMAFDEETSEIIALRAAKRKELEKKAIEANIAQRDAFREAKQKWEDNGMPGPFNPYYKESIQKYVDAAQEDKKETDARNELKSIEADIEKEVIAAKKEMIQMVEEKKERALEAQEILVKHFEDYINSIADIPQDWIDRYEDETGKKAIWRGEITKGFKEFVETNGFL